MERGTESRSKRPRRTNGRGKPQTPAEPPGQPGFVETSELEFDFNQLESESPQADDPGAEPGGANAEAPPEEPADSATVEAPRDTRRSRVDREVPPPPTSPAGGDGREGNGKPPQPIAPPAPPSLPKRRTKPRLKKLRMLFVLMGLSLLA